MANPKISPVTTSSVGADLNILANHDDLVIIPVMLARYDENDWAYHDNGAGFDRTSEFPAGALLGWRADGDHPEAWSADDASDNYGPVRYVEPVYTWTAAAINNRGSGSSATIPASNDDNVLVLMNDFDVADYASSDDGRPIINVAFSGTFLWVKQDAESHDSQPWPVAHPGRFFRIRLLPRTYANVG